MNAPRFANASIIAGLTALAGSVLMAEEPAKSAERKTPYKVCCTVGMVADIVRNVAADKAEVENIIGEGVDPHLYQATRGDIGKLVNADIAFYSGLMLEGKLADTLVSVARKRPVFAVTELIDQSLLLEPPEFVGHFDPHLWMDVSLWKKCAGMVAKTLSEFDSKNADFYKGNYEKYAKQLGDLDGYARKVLSTIPQKSRVIVTAHDAFNYMARAYGLEVKGIQGISTESEAGIEDINRLVALIVERDIQAVFVETSVSQKNMQSLIEGAASKGRKIKIGGNLFSDAMGKAGTYEGTYIGMIDHNVTTIARALGGTAPPKGMNGKLSLIE